MCRETCFMLWCIYLHKSSQHSCNILIRKHLSSFYSGLITLGLEGCLQLLWAGRWTMKRIRQVFVLAICLASLTAYAYHDHDKDKDKDKSKTDATEMSVLGIAAASVLGGGTYLVFRRRARSRG
jgi:hypothetical protein